MLNRSFRGRDKGAAAPAAQTQTQPGARTLAAVMKDKDEDLTLFLEMRKREKERQQSLLFSSNAADALEPLPGSKPGSAPLFKIVSSAPTRRACADDFLTSDGDKNDYDWLLTPPGTPLFPSLEKEAQRSPMGHVGTPRNHPTPLKPRLVNPQGPPARGNSSVSRSPTVFSSISSGIPTRRPASSSGPGSSSTRPATPTTGRPTVHVTSKASRPSTPTSRAAIIPPRPVVASKMASAPAVRSVTPTSRSSTAASTNKAPSLRSTTPARRPSTPSAVTTAPAPPARSSSVTRPTASAAKRSSAPSRGTSPTVRSIPWKPSEMPGFSLDAPPNLRTSMPQRPSSASRGRPGAPISRSLSTVDSGPSGRPRRQSCSPSRGRAPNGVAHSRSSVPAVRRSHSDAANINVSPVEIGTKMVERTVNMRRLAPPKQDDGSPTYAGKSAASPDSSGFGRTLSKKSLDMALRHMDIRRSIPSSLRPLMTSIPASSMYSVRAGRATGSRTISVSDSPLATSSNASSEQSVSNRNIRYLDGIGLEGDEVASDRGALMSSSRTGRTLTR